MNQQRSSQGSDIMASGLLSYNYAFKKLDVAPGDLPLLCRH